MIEKELVTTDAVKSFIEELKRKVYNWVDPSGTGSENWKEYPKNISGKYKLVPTSNEEILDILRQNSLMDDAVIDANKVSYSWDVVNFEFRK